MSTSRSAKPGLLRGIDPSFIVGSLCTVAFYVGINQPLLRESILHRYTTEHAVDYVIVFLFIWGIVDVLFKLGALPRELLALRQDWLPPKSGREPLRHSHELLTAVRSHSPWALESRIGRRLEAVLEFVTEKGSSDEYRDHVKYLADQDDDNRHAAYTLIRFIIGITPVLGFLGTVVHFGTALSGIGYEQMAERLPVIVGEMGQAFNTTTAALAAAMSMMFALFVCERFEARITRTIDRLVERELLNRFEVKHPEVLPFIAGVQAAHEEVLTSITSTLNRQVVAWSDSLQALFQRFDARQQHDTEGWTQALTTLEDRLEKHDARREQHLNEVLKLTDARHEKQLAHIQGTLEQAVSLRDNFGELIETLQSIANGEGRLLDLQTSLSDNLRVLQETHQIEDALHGLTGAIHLFTARTRPGFPDSAAA